MRGEKESVTGQPLLITTYMYMYMYNPPSQFSRLGIQVSLATCTCIYVVCQGYGLVGYFTFFSFLFL